MPERLLPSDRETMLDRFCKEYKLAWEASGSPRRIDVEETFVAALGKNDPPSRAELHALWVFMRSAIERGTPLNWFIGELSRVDPRERAKIDFLRGQARGWLDRFFGH